MHSEAPICETWRDVLHAVHVPGPASFLYVPASHSGQLPSSRLLAPGLQEQATFPPGEYEFAVQSVHGPLSGPVMPALQAHNALPPGESVFARHAVHGPPSGPVEPALQVHAVLPRDEKVLAATHVLQPVALDDAYVPGSHAVHVVRAPALAEYVPAAQLPHAALPTVVLYVPATHTAQMPLSGPVEPALQVQTIEA